MKTCVAKEDGCAGAQEGVLLETKIRFTISEKRKMGPGHSTSQPREGAVNLPVTEVRAAEQALQGLLFTFAAVVVSLYFYIFTSEVCHFSYYLKGRYLLLPTVWALYMFCRVLHPTLALKSNF